ncbi:MAG TPA: MgtC/SapB family protein [Thermoanaerobaculia bacterium]
MIDIGTASLRLLIALFYGSIIGVEREWRHKNAGIKTNTLVAIGAAAFSMVSDTFGPNNHNPAQIAAAVVTGIGFIGAGVIIHRGATVQGVTTAATLWANASMGLAVGLGQIYVGSAIAAAIVIVQFTMRRIGIWINEARVDERVSRIELHVECSREALGGLNATWSRWAKETQARTIRRGITRNEHVWTWRVVFLTTTHEPLEISALEDQLAEVEGVRTVDARFAGYQEEPDAVM